MLEAIKRPRRDATMQGEEGMSTNNEPSETEFQAEPVAVEAPATDVPTEPILAAPIEEIATTADQVIDAVTASQQEALEAVEAAGATMIENVTLAQRAIAEFVSNRIREDIEAQQQLLRCKSFDEVRSVQSKFLKTAMEQYSDNAQLLFRLGTEIVAKSTHRGAA